LNLPFTHDQFLDVFAAYNGALWPLAALLWLVTVAALVALGMHRLGPRMAAALLVVHWALSAGYHLVYFSTINPAARLFGALFLVQAAIFAWVAVDDFGLRVTWGRRPHQVLSVAFCAYAVLYPFVALATGLQWPRMPAFGVPCPTTLLTVGLLLGLAPKRHRGLSVIPVLWCLVAGTAAFQLGIRPDLALYLGAVLLALYVVAPHALGGRAGSAAAA
jgi:peptidoglycan/LPS O-acetylase OafA/YrhL